MATINCTCGNVSRQTNSPLCLVHQSIFTGRPVEIGSAEAIPEGQLPPKVRFDNQVVHAPVLTEDSLLIVDTGRTILELDLDELEVLRAVLFSWDWALVH